MMRISQTVRWLALSLTLSACSHDYQLMRLEEQLNSYGGVMRWSLFKRALDYYARPPSPPPDWQALRDVKVTYYQPLFRDALNEGKIILQTVEIRYIAGGVLERTLTDEQRWEYDENKSRWLLVTGFPKFK